MSSRRRTPPSKVIWSAPRKRRVTSHRLAPVRSEVRRPGVLAGAGLLTLLVAGCAEPRRVVPLTSPADSSSEAALIVAWLLLVATGGAIISTVARRGGTRQTSFVHAVEVGVVAGAALGLVGLAAVVALAGWIASGSLRAGPSLLQVSVTDPADDLLGVVTSYLGVLLLSAGQLLLFAILIGRAGCPRWRRVRGVRGVLVTVLRFIAFVLLLLLDVAALGLQSVFYALIQSNDPTIRFSAPGDQILLGLLGVTMLTARAILLIRLLFREFLGPSRQA